jgi:nicotinate-nucleotide adenylyltransferase
MRLGYFGGSFDPPHRGHLAVACAAAAEFSLDQVLFVPTGRQPLKPGGPMVAFSDRLAMVKILCSADAAGGEQPPSRDEPSPRDATFSAPTFLAPTFSASALEAPRPDGLPNYTVDALSALREQHPPPDRLFVLAGADAFLDLRRWRDPDRLLQMADWIVVSRPGFALHRLDSLGLRSTQRQRVHVLPDLNEPASATEIRRRLGAGEDCGDLLPSGVLTYIREHQLYGV